VATEKIVRTHRKLIVGGAAIGLFLEFLLIPLPRDLPILDSGTVTRILTSGNFYYVLVFPFVIWWWFKVFLRQRVFSRRELGFAYFIFGFYLSSVLRAVAIVAFQIFRLITRG
jgi:hypothetical protein